MSDVILVNILNKLPYEHEFENRVHIFSSQVLAEIIHSCDGVLLHDLFQCGAFHAS